MPPFPSGLPTSPRRRTSKRRSWPSWNMAALAATATLLAAMALAPLAEGRGFECFTGDKDILRRKQCPSVGAYDSDVCFKKIGEDPDDVMRGCFNKVLGTLVAENTNVGCHPIPDKYGTGTICLCDTDLCNSAPPAHSVGATVTLMFSVAASLLLRRLGVFVGGVAS